MASSSTTGDVVSDPPSPAEAAGAPPPVGAGLAVAVCLAVGDLRPAVDPRTGAVTRSTAGIGVTPPDAAALETALRLAGPGGRVVALAVGPPAVDGVLAEVAALGAEVVRLPASAPDPVVDERELARALAVVVREVGPFDLVLCGDRSVDRGTGSLPAFLAHELGVAQALGLVDLRPAGPVPADGADGAGEATGRPALRAVRRLDGGWREQLDVPLPAVCAVEGGLRLRRASLAGALAAAGGTVRVHPAEVRAGPVTATGHGSVHVGAPRPFRPPPHRLPPPEGDDPRLRLLALTGALDTPEPPVVVGPLEAADAADRLLAFVERARSGGEADR